MRRRHRILKENRKELFSVEEVKELSGFTRSQLLTLEEAEIVKPERHPMILYTWHQVIFLKILHNLRKDWTFKQIEKGLKNSEVNVDDFIRNIDKYCFIGFGEKDGELGFAFRFEKPASEFNSRYMDKLLKNPVSFYPIFNILMETSLVHDARMKFNKLTVVILDEVIERLKLSAKEKQIENFELKVG